MTVHTHTTSTSLTAHHTASYVWHHVDLYSIFFKMVLLYFKPLFPVVMPLWAFCMLQFRSQAPYLPTIHLLPHS